MGICNSYVKLPEANWDNALPGPPMANHTLAKTSESVSPKKGG